MPKFNVKYWEGRIPPPEYYGTPDRCDKITYLDVSGFDTKNCTSFNGMFSECYLLEVADVGDFNTSSVTGDGLA